MFAEQQDEDMALEQWPKKEKKEKEAEVGDE
jgi:hypothetical protein